MRRLLFEVRHGLASVTLRYATLTVLSLAVYAYAVKLDANGASGALINVLLSTGDIAAGLAHVWFIFAWGFGIQFLIQIIRIVRRVPKDAPTNRLIRRGAWLSLNAGLFEELIFRVYAFISFVILIRYVNDHLGGFVRTIGASIVLPVVNVLTFGVFDDQFQASQWAVGLGILVGAVFFRNAHRHYGAISKANVFIIGLVMFWLAFHFGVITAIIAHVLYDMAVFAAIALSSPLQPSQPRED